MLQCIAISNSLQQQKLAKDCQCNKHVCVCAILCLAEMSQQQLHVFAAKK